MRRTVGVLVTATMGAWVAGCALLVSFDGLDDGGSGDAAPESEPAIDAGSDRQTGVDVDAGSALSDASLGPDADAADAQRIQDAGDADAAPPLVYLGCFVDQQTNRDLPIVAYRARYNTPARCVSACRALGQSYAGVQFGDECYCGNAFGAWGPVAGCVTNCSGDPTQSCGGSTQNGVYATSTPPPAPAYIGCYGDGMARDLPYAGYPPTTQNRVEACVAACSYHGFAYAGLQAAVQCFCGASYGAYGTASSCDQMCPGNTSEKCGGPYRNGVYRTWFPADVGPLPEASTPGDAAMTSDAARD